MNSLAENEEKIQNRLLELVEEGDPTVILSSEYLESLNELIKHEFVAIDNDKLQLTEKGRQAKALGVKAIMDQSVPVEEQIKLDDFPQTKTMSGVSNRSFLIILFFFLVSLVAMVTAMNSNW